MRRKLRVLFAAFEAVPFMKTGGLGDVAGSLPPVLKGAGCEVRVMLPKFGTIPEEFRSKMTHVTEFQVELGWRSLYCGVEKLQHKGHLPKPLAQQSEIILAQHLKVLIWQRHKTRQRETTRVSVRP